MLVARPERKESVKPVAIHIPEEQNSSSKESEVKGAKVPVSGPPQLVVLSNNGEVAVLEVEGDKLSIIKKMIEGSNSPFLAIYLYKDMLGPLTSDSKSSSKEKKSKQSNSQTEDLDDEDELLYGSSDFSVGMFGVSGANDKSTEEEEAWRKHLEVVSPTFWLVGVRENGNLELYSVKDFTLKFVSHNFPQQADVLADHLKEEAGSPVIEILMLGLGMAGRRPILWRIED